jgi:cytochrome c-type biogenesis protein CcmH/NrfG
MTNEALESISSPGWQAKQAYTMGAVCLVAGLAIGYLFRGSEPAATPAQTMQATQPAAMGGGGGQMPSLEQMKHMAEKKAEPALQKLEKDPNNAALLVQVGDIYTQAHQFKDAADYYQRSLKVDPANSGVRSDLASVLFYEGDVDGALAQLKEALQRDPKNAAALFNLGMIKWQGKQDTSGAVAAWEELMKSNPQLSPDRKAAVRKLIAQAKQHGAQN